MTLTFSGLSFLNHTQLLDRTRHNKVLVKPFGLNFRCNFLLMFVVGVCRSPIVVYVYLVATHKVFTRDNVSYQHLSDS